MKAILQTIKRLRDRVEVRTGDECNGTGLIQSIRGDEVVIDDCFGGAFFFLISKVTGIRIDDGQPTLILVHQ